mmetsp:Transcript_69173/g.102868  ORF Transcript_69173/g.102868 Transcript_69173/m.102868 type:complete len:95 (-) Transcript_69173:91-375(-)
MTDFCDTGELSSPSSSRQEETLEMLEGLFEKLEEGSEEKLRDKGSDFFLTVEWSLLLKASPLGLREVASLALCLRAAARRCDEAAPLMVATYIF